MKKLILANTKTGKLKETPAMVASFWGSPQERKVDVGTGTINGCTVSRRGKKS